MVRLRPLLCEILFHLPFSVQHIHPILHALSSFHSAVIVHDNEIRQSAIFLLLSCTVTRELEPYRIYLLPSLSPLPTSAHDSSLYAVLCGTDNIRGVQQLL